MLSPCQGMHACVWRPGRPGKAEVLQAEPGAQVQRFGTHHRSLYPRICCARGTYIFTSHVGIPVCVWDRRQVTHMRACSLQVVLTAALAALPTAATEFKMTTGTALAPCGCQVPVTLL